MEMIERYIYAVTKRLPESQRKDIGNELRSLIEDMLDERTQGRDMTEMDVEETLLELGHPRRLAQKYRGTKRYLIGPEFYDLYMIVLKIALISTVSVLSLVFVIQVIFNPPNILDYFVSYIVNFFATTVPVILGWTTLGFALAEYFSEGKIKKLDLDKDWKPSKLAPVPEPKRQIKRHEPITGIVFYTLFIIILAFSNEYFGVWIFREGEFAGVIPFLNHKAYDSFLLLILIVFGFGIVKECLKLMYEKWTYKLVVFTAVVNLISMILIMLMVSIVDFWNPNFMGHLVHMGVITDKDAYESVRNIWEQVTLWTLILLVFGLIWDVVAGFIKVHKAS